MINIDILESENCNSDYSLFITFPYDADIIDIIREQPTRYWIKEAKAWEIPFNRLNNLLERLDRYEITLNADASLFKANNKVIAIPNGFKYKTKPFEHQIEGLMFGLGHNKWLLADEQGLGKTKQTIDIAVAKKIEKGYKHCLIICGVNGLKWNWVNEVATHSDEGAYILGQRKKGNRTVIGSSLDKLADLDKIDELPYFIITNVETLRYKVDSGTVTKTGKKAYKYPLTDKLAELCNAGEIQMIAFDEFHKVKDPTTQQGKGILELQAETMIAMTGTPLMNQPMDLYIVLKWLGYETHSIYFFKNHYCEMGGYGNYQIVGYKHLDELQDRLNEIMLRRKKEDVLDLPEKLYIDEYVEMTPKQAQLYKEVASEVMANIDKVKMAVNPLSEMIRMRQVTGYTGILSSTITESAKLDRLVELVSETIENGKKVVVFSNWTSMTDVVCERLKKELGLSVGVITGETKDADRQSIVNNFQNDKACKVLVGTIGAMGTGLTLTAGTVEIFLDHPWNRALYDQAVDRCHRIGQTNNITIYNLLTKDTIDERIWELVCKKGVMADALVDGVYNGDKANLVDFLLS